MYYDKKVSASMRERKKLDFNLSLKSIDTLGSFAGYASVFNVVDNQRDRIQRGAFYRTLKGRVGAIKLLWQHQQDEPIGVFTQIFEDANGLYVEGRLLLDVQRALEAYTLLKAGALSGLSIGYSPTRYSTDSKTGIRTLSEVELWEISLVTFPANSAANVTVVKQVAYDESTQWRQAQKSGHLVALANALDTAIHTLKY
jgi:HK97 family phage prohead protease